MKRLDLMLWLQPSASMARRPSSSEEPGGGAPEGPGGSPGLAGSQLPRVRVGPSAGLVSQSPGGPAPGHVFPGGAPQTSHRKWGVGVRGHTPFAEEESLPVVRLGVPPGVQDGSWKPNGPLDGSGLRETTCWLLGAGAPGGATGDQGPRFASQLHPRGRPWDPEIASSVPQGLSHLFPLTGEDGPALGGPQEPPLHSPSWRGRALGLGGSWPTTCRTPPLAASPPARTTTKGRDSGSPLSFHCYGACPARSQPREPGS